MRTSICSSSYSYSSLLSFPGLNDLTSDGSHLREKFRNFLRSIVVHAKAYPLRFIFICDVRSVFHIEKTFEDTLPPFDLYNFIGGKKVHRFKWEFVNIEHILDKVQKWSKTMQNYFAYNGKKNVSYQGLDLTFDLTSRYNDSLYYISPFYQRIFPKLDKLIVMGKLIDWKFRAKNSV